VFALRLITLAVVLSAVSTFCGCHDLVPRDTASLLIPRMTRAEIFGFVAGLGTTFAAMPDLIVMLRRRSHLGINPRMASISALFQLFWIYYGLLIASRPVIAWNAIAVLINGTNVIVYRHFLLKLMKSGEQSKARSTRNAA